MFDACTVKSELSQTIQRKYCWTMKCGKQWALLPVLIAPQHQWCMRLHASNFKSRHHVYGRGISTDTCDIASMPAQYQNIVGWVAVMENLTKISSNTTDFCSTDDQFVTLCLAEAVVVDTVAGIGEAGFNTSSSSSRLTCQMSLPSARHDKEITSSVTGWLDK